MSVYSYIEVVKPNSESQKDKDLLMGFGHGIHWSYQIAVANGLRTYQGSQRGAYPLEPQFEDITAVSIYEQELPQALQNYLTATQACMSALRLKIPEFEKRLREDLEHLFNAQEWYQKAWLKLPVGVVRLDWGEYVWGMDHETIAKWDCPNSNFARFVQLLADCESVLTSKLTVPEFTTKYSGEYGGATEMEFEL